MDAISESRLGQLHPVLAERTRQMAQILETEGTVVRVTQGLRSWIEQDGLYAMGRTKPGVSCIHDGVARPVGSCQFHPLGVPVTRAKGGYSWHNFALADDVVPDDPDQPGFQPDWDEEHPTWKRIVEVGTSLGLASGISWHDEPHFQLTGRFPVTPTDEVRQIFKDGGMQAVWDEAGIQ